MKHLKPIIAYLLISCLLSGCTNRELSQPPNDNSNTASHMLGLTQEQRLEDYDYLIKTLEDSYLCMGVRDRENPDDLSKDIFQEYRKIIEESNNDEDFYVAVNSTLSRLGQYGHLCFLEPDYYNILVEMYTEDYEDREHWKEILEDPVTIKGYENLQKLLDVMDDKETNKNDETDENNTKTQNVCTLLLPGETIGYIKIDTFTGEYEKAYKKEQKKLFSFYEKLQDCTDLIIDITDNYGGNEGYWQELLVSPFIDRSLSCTNYALLADSKNNHPYIENVFNKDELYPISKLPNLPALNREGIEKADYFVESTLETEPGAYRAPFHGRIWLLVGANVYSASESFSVFCKETGFATLVGHETGGDGIGALDPILLQLPNSGLLVWFTMMFGLNSDGSSSEEAGTIPDISSPDREPPLITALRAIRKMK